MAAHWRCGARCVNTCYVDHSDAGPARQIAVFLADDNLIVREGVRALIERHADLTVVGVAADYDGVVDGATAANPQVLVTDIRMPPSFQREGIDAAKEVRKRHPGTGVVVLSQYEDPEYAVSLLAEGSAGYGYLLKDHMAEGNQLVDAIRAVATGGTALDPTIVEALVAPRRRAGRPDPGRGGAARAGSPRASRSRPSPSARRTAPEAVDAEVEAVFVKLAEGVSAGNAGALQRLRLLHQAIVDREEQGETLSRLLPGGLAEKLRQEHRDIGETERVDRDRADERHPGVLDDRRARRPQPAGGPAEHPPGRDESGHPRRGGYGHAVRGRRGHGGVRRAVPAGRPRRPRRGRGVGHARAAGRDQRRAGRRTGLPAFGLGLGLSTGEAAAALLGSAERLEYTLVGDTVNSSQRLQQFAAAGETVMSEATLRALSRPVETAPLGAQLVKGRDTPVSAYKIIHLAGGSGADRPGPTEMTTRTRGADERRATPALDHARRAQDLRGRERAGARAARGRPRRGQRRVRRPDGPVRLRQVDAAEPGRRPRHGRRGRRSSWPARR